VGKILALTAHTMPGDRERCLADGCDAYMPKPFAPEKLVAAVCEAVGRDGDASSIGNDAQVMEGSLPVRRLNPTSSNAIHLYKMSDVNAIPEGEIVRDAAV
jgi:DNA-binding response OmpR family regulator